MIYRIAFCSQRSKSCGRDLGTRVSLTSLIKTQNQFLSIISPFSVSKFPDRLICEKVFWFHRKSSLAINSLLAPRKLRAAKWCSILPTRPHLFINKFTFFWREFLRLYKFRSGTINFPLLLIKSRRAAIVRVWTKLNPTLLILPQPLNLATGYQCIAFQFT